VIYSIVAVVAIVLVIIAARYYKNEEFTTSSTNETNETNERNENQIVENFPTPPQNVLVSDASGNLKATSDLGLQNLTVSNIETGKLSTPEIYGAPVFKEGNLNVAGGKLQEGGNALVPRGTIVMFNGAAPAGWAICDGGNGTPDLRNRFIVGAGSTYSVGATGGADTVTLTIEQMPKHDHEHDHAPVWFGDAGGSDMAQGGNTKAKPPKWKTEKTGGSQPHENRPPYYALTYIMKL